MDIVFIVEDVKAYNHLFDLNHFVQYNLLKNFNLIYSN